MTNPLVELADDCDNAEAEVRALREANANMQAELSMWIDEMASYVRACRACRGTGELWGSNNGEACPDCAPARVLGRHYLRTTTGHTRLPPDFEQLAREYDAACDARHKAALKSIQERSTTDGH